MSKGVKGLTRVNVKDEVEVCVQALAGTAASVAAGCQQLEVGLARTVGGALIPFVGRVAGELVACCKKLGAKTPEELWCATAAVSLSAGKATARPLCEPMLDILVSDESMRTVASLSAARCFVAVAGRLLPSPLRSAVDYFCVQFLYHVVIFQKPPPPQSRQNPRADHAAVPLHLVGPHVALLSTSLLTPSTLSTPCVTAHAITVLTAVSHASYLSNSTRAAALSTLSGLDGVLHAKAAPLATPTLEDIERHLASLSGKRLGEMATTGGDQPRELTLNSVALTSDADGSAAAPPPPLPAVPRVPFTVGTVAAAEPAVAVGGEGEAGGDGGEKGDDNPFMLSDLSSPLDGQAAGGGASFFSHPRPQVQQLQPPPQELEDEAMPPPPSTPTLLEPREVFSSPLETASDASSSFASAISPASSFDAEALQQQQHPAKRQKLSGDAPLPSIFHTPTAQPALAFPGAATPFLPPPLSEGPAPPAHPVETPDAKEFATMIPDDLGSGDEEDAESDVSSISASIDLPDPDPEQIAPTS
ncbi:hypothetical protein DIPPA_04070 [Diplonema papillatum]|nr:hypothetical protein DIPPA_04070 [Diplonema papillatum]|eukprot:gene18003-27723_t